MLVSMGDGPLVKILMQCLDDFRACSGLSANALKSSLYTTGLVGEKLLEIQEITHFSIGIMPFRYLGIPLAAGKLKVMHIPLY